MDDMNRSISQQRNRRARQSISGREPIVNGVRNSVRSNRSNRSQRSNSIRASAPASASSNPHRSSSIRRDSIGRGSNRSSTRRHHRNNPINVTRTITSTTTTSNFIEYGVECVNNKVQKQIERMFTDVANDEATCSFAVRCLGSLPLQSKVTSLFELQQPLRQLYLAGAGHSVSLTSIFYSF